MCACARAARQTRRAAGASHRLRRRPFAIWFSCPSRADRWPCLRHFSTCSRSASAESARWATGPSTVQHTLRYSLTWLLRWASCSFLMSPGESLGRSIEEARRHPGLPGFCSSPPRTPIFPRYGSGIELCRTTWAAATQGASVAMSSKKPVLCTRQRVDVVPTLRSGFMNITPASTVPVSFDGSILPSPPPLADDDLRRELYTGTTYKCDWRHRPTRPDGRPLPGVWARDEATPSR